MVDATALRAPLVEAAAELGLALTGPQRDALLAYMALLQRWNATYNLTSVRDPAQMLTQHVVDCLAVIGPLHSQAGADRGALRLLDVGSGGGLPGVVLALLFPAWQVTCVDAVGKKAAFIRQAAVELRLPNLHGEHARVENLQVAPFDVITSRAFASLDKFIALTEAHLTAKGIWMAMKGKIPSDEIAALPSNVTLFHVEQLHVPGLNAERCLVWLRRQAPERHSL